MASQPMPDLAASAMNALAHAIEALYTPLANPVAEHGGAAGGRADRGGPATPRSPDRPTLALGALLAGYASGVAGFAVHHAVCQTIVRVCGTPHAQTNAVMLPHFVRMMERERPTRSTRLGDALGERRTARRAATGDDARAGSRDRPSTPARPSSTWRRSPRRPCIATRIRDRPRHAPEPRAMQSYPPVGIERAP